MTQDLPTRPYDHDDEMIARTRQDGTSRVRVYEWSDVSVVIGRGGKQDQELRRENILADGIPLFKRSGGGCSVVLDPGNIIISLVLPLPGVGRISSTFDAISDWLIEGLAICGLSGIQRRGVSDLTLGEKKIGGSCVYRTKGIIYYSTTLLVGHDPELVERYLQHPPREPEYRQGRRHRQFMTCLREQGLVESPLQWRSRLAPILQERLVRLEEAVGFPTS